VTLLVLLARPTVAGIIASDLRPAAYDLLHRLQIARPGHAGLLQFAAFSALERFFDFVHRSRNCARRTPSVPICPRSYRPCLFAFRRATLHRRLILGRPLQNLHQVQIADGLFLEALHHLFEHVEGFALVLDQGIMLAVAAQPDALLEVVHVEEVVFPLRVEHAQHDHALVIAHGIRPDQSFLGVVALFQCVEDRVAQFLAVQRLRLHSLGQNVHPKAREHRVLQGLQVPILGMHLDRAVLVHQVAEDAGDVVFQDQFLLVHTLEQLAAQAVHRLALLVHHVVVFEQVFAGLEVLGFDGLLGFLNAPRDQPRLDRHALFHAQPL
jgi:hypothetical protein